MRKLLQLTALTAVLAGPALAQTTPYYLLDGDASRGFIVQGGVLQSTFVLPLTNGSPLYALRFDAAGDKFLVANRPGNTAVEFNADGTTTGATYTHTQSVEQLLDGGTDGVNTYAIRCCSSAAGVYRGDMQFGGLTQISRLGETGVTFASSIGHIFSIERGGTLYEMALDGTLLNTYGLQAPNIAALAYEESTNSLWLATNASSQIYNYSLNGVQLASYSVAGLGGNFWGGEMANVTTTPEPATLGLFATGLLGVAGVARRRRKGAHGS